MLDSLDSEFLDRKAINLNEAFHESLASDGSNQELRWAVFQIPIGRLPANDFKNFIAKRVRKIRQELPRFPIPQSKSIRGRIPV
jgi:hypothetical protein